MEFQGLFEGKLLWSGHRIEDFTTRELANMAYYHHVDQLKPPSAEDEPTVAEQIELFEENIGQRVSASSIAEEMMRQSMILRGLDPDAKPELSPELAARLEQDGMRSDTDIFFSGDLTKEFRGKQVKAGDDDFE